MKYTKIPVDTFKNLQRNAGVLCTSFTPETGEFDGILGATTGGFQFTAAPSYSDFGEDIDNCAKNMLELKNLDSVDVSLAGTLLTISASMAKRLMASADIDENDETHIIPRRDLLTSDFDDLWWVGDYSDDNSEESGGFCAIHVLNTLNTGGFQIKSGDKAKGQFPFTFTGHVSMDAQDVVPYEVYISSGSGETPSVVFSTHNITVKEGGTANLKVTVTGSEETPTITSGSSSVATYADGKVTGVGEGNTILTATLTDGGVTYTDTCTVVVTE